MGSTDGRRRETALEAQIEGMQQQIELLKERLQVVEERSFVTQADGRIETSIRTKEDEEKIRQLRAIAEDAAAAGKAWQADNEKGRKRWPNDLIRITPDQWEESQFDRNGTVDRLRMERNEIKLRRHRTMQEMANKVQEIDPTPLLSHQVVESNGKWKCTCGWINRAGYIRCGGSSNRHGCGTKLKWELEKVHKDAMEELRRVKWLWYKHW